MQAQSINKKNFVSFLSIPLEKNERKATMLGIIAHAVEKS